MRVTSCFIQSFELEIGIKSLTGTTKNYHNTKTDYNEQIQQGDSWSLVETLKRKNTIKIKLFWQHPNKTVKKYIEVVIS